MGAFTFYERRKEQVRPVTTNLDIDGTVCGTLKKGVVSTRLTNPLDPSYQNPGHLEPTVNDIKGKAGREGFSLAKPMQQRPNTVITSTTQN